MKKTIIVLFNPKISDRIFYVSSLTYKSFLNFFTGQLIEALILGFLCTAGLFILKINYAVLIGVIIGFSSLIPILGAILGTLPCIFILLADNPKSALIFLVFILILQQIEGDLIYPRVVSKRLGLSGFWVLLCLIIGGHLGGIIGIILSIPIFTTFYHIFRHWILDKYEKRG